MNKTLGEIEEKDLLEFFENLKAVCSLPIEGADYESAVQITLGRPSNSDLYELVDNRVPTAQVVVVTGVGYPAFKADALSKGFVDFLDGPTVEAHHLCPCPPGLVNQGDYFVRVNGTVTVKNECIPLSELPNSPEKSALEICALRTKLCESDIKALACAIFDKFKEDEPVACPKLIVGGAIRTTVEGEAPNQTVVNGGPFIKPDFVADVLNDHTIPVALEDHPCFADLDPATKLRIRYNVVGHNLYAETSGYNINIYSGPSSSLVPSPGSMLVAQSASNTIDNSGNFGTEVAAIGEATPWTSVPVDRWVEFDIPLSELLAGIAIRTCAYGGVVGTQESMDGCSVELITDLSDICECDGGSCCCNSSDSGVRITQGEATDVTKRTAEQMKFTEATMVSQELQSAYVKGAVAVTAVVMKDFRAKLSIKEVVKGDDKGEVKEEATEVVEEREVQSDR